MFVCVCLVFNHDSFCTVNHVETEMPKRRRRKITETSGSCWNLKTRQVLLMENAGQKEELPVTPAGREALRDARLP